MPSTTIVLIVHRGGMIPTVADTQARKHWNCVLMAQHAVIAATLSQVVRSTIENESLLTLSGVVSILSGILTLTLSFRLRGMCSGMGRQATGAV